MIVTERNQRAKGSEWPSEASSVRERARAISPRLDYLKLKGDNYRLAWVAGVLRGRRRGVRAQSAIEVPSLRSWIVLRPRTLLLPPRRTPATQANYGYTVSSRFLFLWSSFWQGKKGDIYVNAGLKRGRLRFSWLLAIDFYLIIRLILSWNYTCLLLQENYSNNWNNGNSWCLQA